MAAFVLKNGRVIDPHQGIDQVADVYVNDGRIVSVGDKQEVDGDVDWSTEINVKDCIVTPGLIDLHIHGYQHATPLGVDIDEKCLARGVSTVVDAGSSGSTTFPGLRHFIKERKKCRLYCWLHIAQHGLASAACAGPDVPGECDSLRPVNVRHCCEVINSNRDMIIGVKVRLARDVANNGKNEQEVFRRALQASGECNVPLMVHHSYSSVEWTGQNGLLGCPGDLRAGDVYTHCFHCTAMLNPNSGRVDPAYWEAKKRGVIFDVGHGKGSFSWPVLEQCAREGFWPDVISTDLHLENMDGPVYDLPCVMSKLLYVGMSLNDIIAAVTCRPAKVIGKLSEHGHLSPGQVADITVLKLNDRCIELPDSQGNCRALQQVFTPVQVYAAGERVKVEPKGSLPN